MYLGLFFMSKWNKYLQITMVHFEQISVLGGPKSFKEPYFSIP